MSQNNDHNNDPKNDPSQDQDQLQAQLQAELQGQGQGQAQGQGQGQAQAQAEFQLAAQAVGQYAESENKNDNENSNDNKNENDNSNELTNELDNSVDNKLDNSVDNKLDNSVENKVENVVENKVETTVDVKVDLDLDLDSLSRPVDNDAIDIDWIKDIDGSVVMPDVVTQTLTGDGNQFNIDQVNNIVDKDFLWDPDVTFNGKGGDLRFDAKAEGGDVKVDDVKAEIGGDGTMGDTVAATADALVSQEAFTQNIVMGANIQFNSIDMTVAGHDLTDDHAI